MLPQKKENKVKKPHSKWRTVLATTVDIHGIQQSKLSYNGMW